LAGGTAGFTISAGINDPTANIGTQTQDTRVWQSLIGDDTNNEWDTYTNVYEEEHQGAGGTDATVTLAQTPVRAVRGLYRNGMRMRYTEDYTIVLATGVVTCVSAIGTDEYVVADYAY
jgi:hypothetical protein